MDKKNRFIQIAILFSIVAVIYLGRLFSMQVWQDTYKKQAQNNAVKRVISYPSRGLMYDRNGKLIVYNDIVYDLFVVPGKVQDLDTALFCQVFKVDTAYFRQRMQDAKRYSKYLPTQFLKQIPQSMYSSIREYMYQFPGFFTEIRSIRSYPYRSGANVLGYIGEVSDNDIKKSQGFYQSGDYKGISGLELNYESYIRGTRGVRYVQVDRFSREKGSYQEGKLDTLAQAGSDLFTTLDIDLQGYGEELMAGKVGSIVAIEPKSGEVLAFVSSPSYDPNLLTGAYRGHNYSVLQKDSIGKPLINRPLTGAYPPGSTFKPLMGLIALQEKLITVDYGYSCRGGYRLGKHTVGCHGHPFASNINVATAYSCNSYFCQLFKLVVQDDSTRTIPEAYTNWRKHLADWGMGVRTGIDLKGEYKGNIPTAEYYDKMIGTGEWKGTTIISLGIGQGEMLATPLQMANVVAGIANDGTWITPHLVKGVKDQPDALKDKLFKHVTQITDTSYYKSIKKGMEGAIKYGTAKRVAKPEGITMAGKTGTAQNPHGADHSWFVAFSPVDTPRIAVAVVVENSGFGAKWAAPIASLMIEKYLKGEIKGKARKALEERMKKGRILKRY